MLRVSVAVVNWLWPSPRTIEYQVTLSYAGVVEVGFTQPVAAKSAKGIMECPSYPMGSSETVFARRLNKQKKFTFLNARSELPLEAIGDPIRGEQRLYRLAGKCVTSGCLHWTGLACQLGATVAGVKIRRKHENFCAIRTSCRWYAENSNDACSTCAFIHHSTLLSSGRVQ